MIPETDDEEVLREGLHVFLDRLLPAPGERWRYQFGSHVERLRIKDVGDNGVGLLSMSNAKVPVQPVPAHGKPRWKYKCYKHLYPFSTWILLRLEGRLTKAVTGGRVAH